eukprot:TRINITY_DN3713_c1_g1_i15.p1 TRINITY_DN3713_c1_g1~~TRINITY_DN3713_c1_g1_i15.p1  ORF type:complete len:222 (+),score=-23.89 TRINITY_DN3713_c1_g1_i15:3-668(+)
MPSQNTPLYIYIYIVYIYFKYNIYIQNKYFVFILIILFKQVLSPKKYLYKHDIRWFSLTLRCGLVCPLNLYAFTPKVWPLLNMPNINYQCSTFIFTSKEEILRIELIYMILSDFLLQCSTFDPKQSYLLAPINRKKKVNFFNQKSTENLLKQDLNEHFLRFQLKFQFIQIRISSKQKKFTFIAKKVTPTIIKSTKNFQNRISVNIFLRFQLENSNLSEYAF